MPTATIRMDRICARTSLAVAALFLAACPRPPHDGGSDAGAVAVIDASAAVELPPPPRELRFQVIADSLDGGLQFIPVAPGTRPLISPASGLIVTTNLPLRNYRIRTFDDADRALVSDDVPEESDAGITYRIAFPTPLKPGHKYSVVMDAQTGASFTDDLGEPLADQRVEFQIAGEKERPASPPKKPGKKKRR